MQLCWVGFFAALADHASLDTTALSLH